MTTVHIAYSVIHNKVKNSLSKYVKSKNSNMFQDIFDSKLSAETKCFIEAAVRQHVVGLLNVQGHINLEEIKFVIKICFVGAREEICLPTLPIVILSDTFDCITIQQCEDLFAFVESYVSVLKEPQFFSMCKNQVLRMCNDVLRRLSRTQNTIFCGRILLFLARFFPFAERSGLNLISEFNLENITLLTSTEPELLEEKDMTDNDITPRPSRDYTLYTKFWALQDFFRSPIQCYQDEPWKLFTQNCDDVLEAFKSFKLDNIQGSQTENLNESGNDTSMENSDEVDEYFPKYLNSQKLLDLQFSDSNFRRYILVQMLILGHYLTSNIKFKQETLDESQVSWVKQMQEKAFGLIAETPPNGKQFVSAVKVYLKRESFWNDWKNVGCPEIKKPGSSLKRKLQDTKQNGKQEKREEVSESPKKREKRRLGDIIREAESKNRFIMSNAEMSRLWNICPDNLEACQKDCRDFEPSLESYFAEAVEQVHSNSPIKEASKLVNNSNFGWRALRLLASKSPHFFTNSGNTIIALPDYLTSMIKKVAKDIPSLLTEEKLKDGAEGEEEIEDVNQGESIKEDVEMEEEEAEEEETQREETKPISETDRKVLSKALAEDPNACKLLGKKIGFDEDELDWFMQTKPLCNGIEIMLERWVENEEDEANKEMLIYIMEGLKLHTIVKKVFE